MKEISLVGFGSMGLSNPRVSREPFFIRSGHVGMAFEGYKRSILGFAPTKEAIKQAGGEKAAIEYLKAGNTLEGCLTEDYKIFLYARKYTKTLAPDSARNTTVIQYAIEFTDEDFARVREQIMTWYNEHKTFLYAFPNKPLLSDRDNCASFPRRIGLPVFDGIGQIKDYIEGMKKVGKLWMPDER